MYKHYLRRFFMNNAKNEGSDASRLALALLKGTAVGIGAAAVLMPILALAAYSSPDPSKLTVYLGYAAFALAGGGIRDRRRKIHRRRNASRRDIGGGTVRACFRRFSSHRRRKRDLSRPYPAAFHFGAVLLGGAVRSSQRESRKPKKRAKHSSPKKAPRRRSR